MTGRGGVLNFAFFSNFMLKKLVTQCRKLVSVVKIGFSFVKNVLCRDLLNQSLFFNRACLIVARNSHLWYSYGTAPL